MPVTIDRYGSASLHNGLSNLKCLTTKQIMFDAKLGHVFALCVHTYDITVGIFGALNLMF